MYKNKEILKILFITQIFYPAIYGGSEYIFYQWAKELAKKGHKIIVITQNLRGINRKDTINDIIIIRVGPPIDYKGYLTPTFYHNIGFYLMAFFYGFFTIIKYKLDIIHSNAYIPAFVGQVLSIIFHRPHIITIHDIYGLGRSDFWSRWANQFNDSRYYSFFGDLIERLCLALPASAFHTVSETSKREIERYIKNQKIVVIPNGIDENNYKFDKIKNETYAVYIGRLVFYKNLEVVINSFNMLNYKPQYKLVIVGDGPYRSKLWEIAQNNKNIIFLGRINNKKKIDLLNNCSFLVLPSLIEGFGIVIIEAFACKKPVLVSKVMPLPELVNDGNDGFTIPPFDLDKWKEKINYMFEHPNETKNMGENGYKKFKQFYSIDIIVKRLERLYFSINHYA
jgi:glycosyltransferase involved in cell wall biosynthesis